jgi:hypothetical protein
MREPRRLKRWVRSSVALAATGGMLLLGKAWGQTEPSDPLTALTAPRSDTPATQPTDTGNSDPQAAMHRQNTHDLDPLAITAAAHVAQLADELTNDQVRTAIAHGSDYLLQQLVSDGKIVHIGPGDQRPWIRFAGDQEVGVISMCAYALLEAGRFTDDPRLKPFSKEMEPLTSWIIAARTGKTYSAAFQANVLALLPPRPEVLKALKHVRDQLTAGMRADGGYSYTLGPSPQWDNSNTQYGLLGLWAIAEAGVETPQHFWQAADAHWRQTQAVSGGWAYKTPIEGFVPDGEVDAAVATPTLTAAGVASLFVTLDHLNGGARQPAQDRALERGLAAVEADFGQNQQLLSDSLYYAYGIQRVGVASGLKYIDHINWYRRGAAALLISEQQDGAWTYGYSKLVGTAYALLFLTHGGSPVIFNKLQYAGTWNNSPRDDANLTRRLSHTLEMPLNWQIVSMDSDPEDWLDAPVLMITGHGNPKFGAPEIEKLRTFIHAGGIVFSIADGGDENFTAAIRDVAAQATGGQYPMRELPPDHPLFTLYEKVKDPPKILAISNGTRELWIHSPEDFAATWQHLAYSEKERWSIPLNLFFYATGRLHPHNRLESLEVRNNASPPDARLTLAEVAYTGNADPEPGAWPRFGRLMKRDARTQLDLQTVDVHALDARQTPLAHLTGNDHFTLDEAARQQLRTFLQQGGTLIGDSTGGSEAFTESFLDLTRSLAPDSQIDILPADSALFDGSIAGTIKIGKDQVEFRKSTPLNRRASGRAEIWAWKVNGRYAILFSPLDITSGLLGTDTWGISGYAPAFAQTLARDLVLYAARMQPPVATTMPAATQETPSPGTSPAP